MSASARSFRILAWYEATSQPGSARGWPGSRHCRRTPGRFRSSRLTHRSFPARARQPEACRWCTRREQLSAPRRSPSLNSHLQNDASGYFYFQGSRFRLDAMCTCVLIGATWTPVHFPVPVMAAACVEPRPQHFNCRTLNPADHPINFFTTVPPTLVSRMSKPPNRFESRR